MVKVVRTLLVVGFVALVLGGCGVTLRDGDDASTAVTVPMAAPPDDLLGTWSTTDADGTCGTFRRSTEPRLLEITVDDDGDLRVIELSGNGCLGDGAVAFEATSRAGDRVEGSAFGGPIGVPNAFPASMEVTADGDLLLTVGTTEVVFERLTGPPGADDRSALLGIPTPEEALTTRNVGLAGLTMLVLLVLVSFPTTMLGGVIDANLDRWRSSSLAESWRRMSGTGSGGVTIWQRWRGLAIGFVGTAAAFSLVQPGWGANPATAVTLVAFLLSLIITSGATVWLRWRFHHRRGRGGLGRPEVVPSTGLLAVACSLVSRAIGFSPGYAYPIAASYDTDPPADRRAEADLLARTTTVTFVLAIGGWLAYGLLARLPGEGNVEVVSMAAAAGTFIVGVDALVIGLIPIRLFAGHELREMRPRTWVACWVGGAFLFALVLLRPGLATGETRSTWVTLGFAAAFAIGVLVSWRRSVRRVEPQVRRF